MPQSQRTFPLAILLIASAVVLACAQSLPSVDLARAEFESKNARWIKEWDIKVLDVKKVDGKMMEFMGVKRYELKYQATLEWPRGQTCSMVQLSLGCKKRGAGERGTVDGTIAFEKSEKGWNVTD